MAKSIRSKWRQRMRNEKRQKNYNKDLERLKGLAARELASKKKEIEEQTELNSQKGATNSLQDSQHSETTPSAMDTTTLKKYNKRTMLDESGQYPIWMSQRKIKKMKGQVVKKKSSKRQR